MLALFQVNLVRGKGLSIADARNLKTGSMTAALRPYPSGLMPGFAQPVVFLPGSAAAAAAPLGEPPWSHVHVRQHQGCELGLCDIYVLLHFESSLKVSLPTLQVHCSHARAGALHPQPCC